MNKCADFCQEHSGMIEFKNEMKRSNEELWKAVGTVRNLLVGTLITTIATLTGVLVNLVIRHSGG